MPNTSLPDYWSRPGLVPSLLEPIAQAYAAIGAARRALSVPYRAAVPVICVGNLVVGGAGKTPIVASLARRLMAQEMRPAILSRGYGGDLAGPVAVDPARHDASQVGDEPLMLAGVAPVWVAKDKPAGAKAAIEAGAQCLILDDGFQNPLIAKDLSLLVIDGQYGLGNGRVMPAGPLREPALAGLARADAIVLMGEDRTGLTRRIAKPVLRAELVPTDAAAVKNRSVVAFAGIGRPEKFFATLEAAGALVVARHPFPDHHRYRESELDKLAAEAAAKNAILVTTEKDRVRLAPDWRSRVTALAVEVAWRDEPALAALLAAIFRHA